MPFTGPIMTTLRQLLAHFDTLDDDATIYAARPWSSSSKAVSCHEDDAEARAAIEAGLEYMLEVNLAQDAIRAWGERRRGKTPTLAQQCDAVIYYAEHDAHIDNV